jgi:hypothetical protein
MSNVSQLPRPKFAVSAKSVSQFFLLNLVNRVTERDGKRCAAVPVHCPKLDWQQSTCKGKTIYRAAGNGAPEGTVRRYSLWDWRAQKNPALCRVFGFPGSSGRI